MARQCAVAWQPAGAVGRETANDARAASHGEVRSSSGGRLIIFMLCRGAGFALRLLIFASVPHFGGAAAETVDVTPAGAARQFLMLSDLHFDPMADRELVDRLAAT